MNLGSTGDMLVSPGRCPQGVHDGDCRSSASVYVWSSVSGLVWSSVLETAESRCLNGEWG